MIINQKTAILISSIILSFIWFTFAYHTSPIFAFNFDQDRLTYQQNYSSYREQLVGFRVARSEYMTYQTLESRTRAINITQQFLSQRQQVILSYLTMLKSKLDSTPNQYLSSDVSTLITQINQQLDHQQDFVPIIQNVSTIDDIVGVSNQVDASLPALAGVGYRVQAYIIDSRVKEYHETTANLIGVTTEQVRRISKEGKKNTSTTDRWLLDAEQKFTLASKSLNSAESSIPNITNDQSFQIFRSDLQKSKQYLKETNILLSQIITNLKIK